MISTASKQLRPTDTVSYKNELFENLYLYALSNLPVVIAGDFDVLDQILTDFQSLPIQKGAKR